MKRLTAIFFILTLAGSLYADGTQTPAKDQKPSTVTVSAEGADVRKVLSDLFNQTSKNFVLAPDIHFVLYLSLKDMDFEEALQLICKTSSLKYDVRNGIYFVTKNKAGANPAPAEPKATADPKTGVDKPNLKSGTLSRLVLNKHVTTKLSKVDIRDLFQKFTDQTGVMIEVAPDIPAYKFDAFLTNTSLRYALTQITEAAKLAYRFTDHLSIEIYKPVEEQNKVSVVTPSG